MQPGVSVLQVYWLMLLVSKPFQTGGCAHAEEFDGIVGDIGLHGDPCLLGNHQGITSTANRQCKNWPLCPKGHGVEGGCDDFARGALGHFKSCFGAGIPIS